jgi:VHS domain
VLLLLLTAAHTPRPCFEHSRTPLMMSSVSLGICSRMSALKTLELTKNSIAKATDENLTSENWEYIMDVCDKVMAEENGGKDTVASMIKRLAHRNANVQLYTLEVSFFVVSL